MIEKDDVYSQLAAILDVGLDKLIMRVRRKTKPSFHDLILVYIDI